MKSTQHYVYADGSDNRYIITPDSLAYDPITPEESGTGTYSGGEPDTIAISHEQFESISVLIDKAVANKSAHTKDRIKTSGVISVVNGNIRTEVILAPRSHEKAALETLLRTMMEGK